MQITSFVVRRKLADVDYSVLLEKDLDVRCMINDEQVEAYEVRTSSDKWVTLEDFIENEVAFGATQHPKLEDYADGVNTLEFLSKLS